MGIDGAGGRWLLFADADDRFTNDAFSVFDNYIKSDYDIISFSYCITTTDDKIYKGSIKNKRLKDILIKEYNDSYNRKPLVSFHWEPWAKMFSHGFIQIYHIRFESTMVMNDAYFSVFAGIMASRFKAVADSVYIYHVYGGSTARSFDKQKDFSRLKQIIKINNLLMENGYYLYVRSYLGQFIKIFKRYGFMSFVQAIRLVLHNEHHYVLFPLYIISPAIRGFRDYIIMTKRCHLSL
jgi:hypothetical protein